MRPVIGCNFNLIAAALLAFNEVLAVRLIAAGMDVHATLNRLFEEQLAGGTFAEAEYLIWIMHSPPVQEGSTVVDLISSGAWLDPLRGVKAYSAVIPSAPERK